jgi:hypothetical protein
MVMKSSILWDITQRSPLKVNRRFGEKYRLYLQGRRSRVRNQCESSSQGNFQKTTLRCISEDRIFRI